MANLGGFSENTYRQEPREDCRFYPSKVRACIEECINKHMKDKEVYDHQTSKVMAEKLAEEIKQSVK